MQDFINRRQLSKLLSERFKRPVYLDKYKVIPNNTYNRNHYIKELLAVSHQGVKRLFLLAYNNDANTISVDSHQRYFLPRIKIENYDIEIDERNLYDQPINDLVKHYDEVRKVSTGQGGDYTTGCLLVFAYFLKKIQINCC